MARPGTAMGEDMPLPVKPPGVEVATTLVMGKPPLAFNVNAADAVVDPGAMLAVPMVGAAGTVDGVKAADGVDGEDRPATLRAWTVTVYVTPFTKPAMRIGLAAPLALRPPGLAVTR